MSRVDGPGGPSAARPDAARESQSTPGKGEFDKVLDQKERGGPEGGQTSTGSGATTTTGQALGIEARGQQQRGGGGQGNQGGAGAGPGAPRLGEVGDTLGGLEVARSLRPLPTGSVRLGGMAGGLDPSLPRILDPGFASKGAQLPGGATAGAAASATAPPANPSAAEAAAAGLRKRADDEASSTAGVEGAAAAAGAGGSPMASAPTAETITLPHVDGDSLRLLADKVATSMELHLVANRTDLTIGLDLGALGGGQVHIERGEKGVSIGFQLANSEAAAFLAERLPQLERALGDRGIAVAQLEATAPGELPKAAAAEQRGGQGDGSRERRGGDHGDGRSRGRFEPFTEDEA